VIARFTFFPWIIWIRKPDFFTNIKFYAWHSLIRAAVLYLNHEVVVERLMKILRILLSSYFKVTQRIFSLS